MTLQLNMCRNCYQKLLKFGACTTQFRHFSQNWNAKNSKDIRSMFLEFFCNKNTHQYIRPSSVIPGKDQGVYFTNAGMNQFKPIFLGTVSPGSEMSTFRRAANSQKCVRVGGKHNDLADVGVDLTHHTFFEMLGSWSFGDYFKVEACSMALELLVHVYKLPMDRLYFTYFGGDPSLGLEPDYECREIWRKLGVPEKQILPFGMKDNFWDMGDTGPCGPCTEIHYDHIGGKDRSMWVNTGSPEVVEIWNLVFMQYNRQKDGQLIPLPCKHVDTGMGLERICAVLQGTMSNYNTDLFLPIFKVIQQETGAPPYSDKTGSHDSAGVDTAYRIVADHVRMATVCISDGLLPGRELLEQRLRSVIYRALYQCQQVLKSKEGLTGKLVDPVVDSLGGAFPEISHNSNKVKTVLAETEQRYLQSEKDGRKNFRKLLKQKPNTTTLESDDIKKLHTGFYGDSLSLDMIELVARTQGLQLQPEAIATIAEEDKVFPTIETVYPWLTQEAVTLLSNRNIPVTNDNYKYQYEKQNNKYVFEPLQGHTLCLLDEKNACVEIAVTGDRVGVILDQTQFYSEKGGQAGDEGRIKSQTGILQVTDTQSRDDYVLHIGSVIEGSIAVGQDITMEIDAESRTGCMMNHTCTHLLGAALRKVLGQDVAQQGSSIDSEKFTYNFSCVPKVKSKEIEEVERLVRETIHQKLPVHRNMMQLKEALSNPEVIHLESAIYPNEIFVVSLETPEDVVLKSSELCGGTHLLNTADIEEFCITSLTGLGSGTKTVTCLTGAHAKQAIQNATDTEVMFKELVKDVKSGSDVDSCVALRKTIHTRLSDLDMPKTVRDRLIDALDKLGTSINTLLSQQGLQQMIETMQIKIDGPDKFIVHEVSAKSLQRVTNKLKNLETTKPCIVIVKTTNSMSAVFLLPQTLLADRSSLITAFQEKFKISTVIISDQQLAIVNIKDKNKTDVLLHAAEEILEKYIHKKSGAASV